MPVVMETEWKEVAAVSNGEAPSPKPQVINWIREQSFYYPCNKKNAELFLSNCAIFRAKKLKTKTKTTTKKKQRELQKKQSRILPEYRRYNREDSWLNGPNAIKTKIAFIKDRLKFSSKIVTAARQCSPYEISFK